MRYLGGKSKIAKRLAAFVQTYVDDATAYYEPFLGGCNVLPLIRHGLRHGSDANEALITLYRAVYQHGWIPPDEVTEDGYKRLRERSNADDPLTAFAGFTCSFGGKYFDGYARGESRNYAAEGKRALLKHSDAMRGVTLSSGSYADLSPIPGSVIYCDPPYAGTTGYGAVGEFDHAAFWQWVRDTSRTCTVFVSEYQAPDDFNVIWEAAKRHNMDNRREGKMRTECLFVHGENFLFKSA